MCSGLFSSSIRANREHKPPMPMAYNSQFVEELREFVPHLKEAKFLGGEPFLIDIYYEIWELFVELNPNCIISITTNGTAVSPSILRFLEKLNFYIVVSLDSLDKPIYESIRQNAKLERVLANVETFHAISKKRGRTMTFAVCPMVNNWPGIPDLVNFANERDAHIYFNTVTYPSEQSIRSLTRKQKHEVVSHLRGSLRNAQTDSQARNFRAVEDLCRQIDAWAQ